MSKFDNIYESMMNENIAQDWNKKNAEISSEMKKFAGKLDKYISYLKSQEKSAKAYVHGHPSGDVKADYENLMRRVQELPMYIKEVDSLLNKTKNL
jgi:hypothetical protein